MKVIEAKDSKDLESFYQVVKELREHLSLDEFFAIYNQAHLENNYTLVALEEEGNILAVMGYRFISDYVHGKHLYIDDLVTTKKQRSKGLGVLLLSYAENLAQKSGCKMLRLCTGIDNELGKKFYQKNGWDLRAVAFKKKLLNVENF